MEKDKIRVCRTKPGISNGLAKVMAPKCTRIRSHQFTMKDSFGLKQIISQDFFPGKSGCELYFY